jgi:hypothetical protein
MRAMTTKLLLLGVGLGAVVLLYAFLFRPWLLDWGSTAEERARQLPGDQIVSVPAKTTTRAVTIRSSAAAAFPWLAQLGQNRGGFYSFELLEDLVGSEMPRAETLLPGAQEWLPGDSLWMYPWDKADGVGEAPLVEHVPGRALAFATWNPATSRKLPPDGSWAFVIEPMGEGASRFLVRGRGAPVPGVGAWLFDRVVFEPMHFVMERRMMEGIRALAEGRTPRGRLADAAEIFVWAAALGLFFWGVGATLLRARWAVPLALTVVAALGFVATTLLQPPAWIGLPAVAILAWAMRRGAVRPDLESAGTGEDLRSAVAGRA